MIDMPATTSPRRLPWFQLGAAMLGSLVLLLVIAPLAGLVLSSSAKELSAAAAERDVLQSLRLTLTAALAATAVCTLGGVPLAYLLARRRFWGRSAVLAIIDLPIVIPHSAAGLALLTLIGRRSLVGSAAEGWGVPLVGIFSAFASTAIVSILLVLAIRPRQLDQTD